MLKYFQNTIKKFRILDHLKPSKNCKKSSQKKVQTVYSRQFDHPKKLVANLSYGWFGQTVQN
jgi:hypothetical protein